MWPQREKIDLSLMPNVINLDYHFTKVFFLKKIMIINIIY